MSNASKPAVLSASRLVPTLALALLLCTTASVMATPAVEPVPAALPEPAIDQPDPALAPAPAETVVVADPAPVEPEQAAQASQAPTPVSAAEMAISETPRNEDILQTLRSGNNGKPLSVAQLAAINDMLKRMEFLAEVEGKMQQMSLGGMGSSSSGAYAAVPVSTQQRPASGQTTQPASVASGSNLSVVRITGVSGEYAATLTNGNTLMTVRVGDQTDLGRVQRIGVDGVRISGGGGVSTLPFSSTTAIAGVTFGR